MIQFVYTHGTNEMSPACPTRTWAQKPWKEDKMDTLDNKKKIKLLEGKELFNLWSTCTGQEDDDNSSTQPPNCKRVEIGQIFPFWPLFFTQAQKIISPQLKSWSCSLFESCLYRYVLLPSSLLSIVLYTLILGNVRREGLFGGAGGEKSLLWTCSGWRNY